MKHIWKKLLATALLPCLLAGCGRLCRAPGQQAEPHGKGGKVEQYARLFHSRLLRQHQLRLAVSIRCQGHGLTTG